MSLIFQFHDGHTLNLLNAPPEMISTQHNVRRGADKQTE